MHFPGSAHYGLRESNTSICTKHSKLYQLKIYVLNKINDLANYLIYLVIKVIIIKKERERVIYQLILRKVAYNTIVSNPNNGPKR